MFSAGKTLAFAASFSSLTIYSCLFFKQYFAAKTAHINLTTGEEASYLVNLAITGKNAVQDHGRIETENATENKSDVSTKYPPAGHKRDFF